jgi:hypothetical protein
MEADVVGYGNKIRNYKGVEVYSPFTQTHYDMIAKWAGLM